MLTSAFEMHPWLSVSLFLAGWALGLVLEYVLHWAMHHWTLGFHLRHHHEFFHLETREVAIRTADPRLNLKFFGVALVALAPVMFLVGWLPVVLLWAGAFWHLVPFYETCHALQHHEAWLPAWVRDNRLLKWWKGCHFEHHFHRPTRNFSVTCPWLDMLFGTYSAPKASYPPLPHPKLKPVRPEGYSLPEPDGQNRI
jgi:sterol desaturase/sphingolipid hydroxylase (fatty acid hydroxylase superfamily)